MPGRTGVNLTPKMVAKLAKISNIIGIKEASGDISQVAEIARLCGTDFSIYSGNDDIIIPVLSLGGKGVISVLANILPKVTHDLVSSYLEGEVNKARDLQLSVNGLVHTLFIEVNPIPVKTAMNLMGMNVRKPPPSFNRNGSRKFSNFTRRTNEVRIIARGDIRC